MTMTKRHSSLQFFLCNRPHRHSAAEQAITIFFILCDLEPDWLYGLGQMLFPHSLVSVVCGTGRRNADGQDVIFHVLAHRGHMFFASSPSGR